MLEKQLGNIIGEEVYFQTEAPIEGSNFGTMYPRGKQLQQLTESDFVLLRAGSDWMALRSVRCVDGKLVQHPPQDLEKIFDDTPTGVSQKIDHILRESASYNIGVMERNTNVPTMPLEILHPDNIHRFEFQRLEDSEIGGVPVWAIGYHEIRGPALIRDKAGHDELTHGTLWIAPESGQILKTEMNVEHPRWSRAQMIVSYAPDSALQMLVPAIMEEHYVVQGMKPSDGSRSVDCKAEYYNFHRFNVETKLNFGPRPPAG